MVMVTGVQMVQPGGVLREQRLRVLQKREHQLKREIAKAQLYNDGTKTSFWKSIEEILTQRLDVIKAEKLKEENGLTNSNDRRLIRLLGNEEIVVSILSIKTFSKSLQKFKDLLLETQKEIEKITDR